MKKINTAEPLTINKEVKIGKTVYIIEEHFAQEGKTLQETLESIILHKVKSETKSAA